MFFFLKINNKFIYVHLFIVILGVTLFKGVCIGDISFLFNSSISCSSWASSLSIHLYTESFADFFISLTHLATNNITKGAGTTKIPNIVTSNDRYYF